MNIFYKITILLFAGGATAGIAQIILTREISNQAFLTGNLMLFMALSWIAGAVLAFQTVKNIASAKASEKNLNQTAAIMPVINAFFITASVILVRYFKPAMKMGPDNIAPDWAAMILCAAVFIPIGYMVFASVFSLMEALKKSKAPGFVPVSAVSFAAGAAAVIVLYFLWAVKYYSNLEVVYTLGLFNLAIAYLFFRDKTIEGRWLMLTVIGALIVYIGFNMAGVREKVDKASMRAMYSGYTVIAQKEFPTVNFCMVKKNDEYRVYENGTLAYKMPDVKHAMIARLAKGPRVLVINGGLAGMADALSKNTSVKKIVCVESDPYVAVVLEKAYGKYMQENNALKFISAGNTGGIAEAVKTSGKFDTIIVNPLLQGHPEGRYYFSTGFKSRMDSMLVSGGQVIYGGNK